MVKAMAHITGGGLLENIPRVLPEEARAVVDADSWPPPALMAFLQGQCGLLCHPPGGIPPEDIQSPVILQDLFDLGDCFPVDIVHQRLTNQVRVPVRFTLLDIPVGASGFVPILGL